MNALIQPAIRRITPALESSVLARLLRENFRAHAGLYAMAILCMLAVAGCTTFSAWILRDLVNSSVVDRNFEKVLVIAAMVASVFTIKGFATYFQSVFLSRAGNAIIATQQMKVYNRILSQDVNFFSANASSDLIVRITHGAQAARQVIDIIVTAFVRDLFTLIGLVAVMVFQQPMVAIAIFVVGPLAFFFVRGLLVKVKRLMEQEMASIGVIVQLVQETTIGNRVIKTFALEDLMRRRVEKAVRDVETRANGIVRLEAATSPIMETLGGLAIAGMLVLSAFMVIRGTATPGELVSFMAALLLAYDPAKRLARMRVSIEAGMIGARLMFQMLDVPIRLSEKPGAVPLVPGRGEIAFQDVTFNYSPDSPVIDAMTFTFPAGKTTALVGPSGGGKSTIINLIMRLYDPVEGRVMIDGQDLRDVTFASLRERISFVGQDTFLFQGTVGFNIGLGRSGATQDEIIAAARAANAHDFIMAMPNGYDSHVGDNGNNLSGGQRQRIAIARAILKNGDILILDEATSALDSHSESAVREAIEHAADGRTTIVIAHRLSTITKADIVVYVESGRIIETGNQNDLLQRKGAYRELYDKQFLPAV